MNLIEWDELQVRVNGERIDELLQSMRVAPLEQLHVRFFNGRMRVEGVIRKFLAVPFSVDIPEIVARGTTVRVPLRNAQAFGGIPIPQFLFSLFRDRLPKIVSYEEPATIVVSLDRFLPPFVRADIQKIWIIDGGLAVTLGRGGADPPANFGGTES